jgi:hypothetical protein
MNFSCNIHGNIGLRKRALVRMRSLTRQSRRFAHLVLQFSVQVKTWETSCFAGITERWSSVFDISRSKSFHTVVQRNWLSRTKCNECEGVSSFDSKPCGRFFGGWGPRFYRVLHQPTDFKPKISVLRRGQRVRTDIYIYIYIYIYILCMCVYTQRRQP